MGFVSKLMVPKNNIINQELLGFAPKSLRSAYKSTIFEILEGGEQGFISLILIYRGYTGYWIKHNCEIRVMKRIGNMVQFSLIFESAQKMDSGPIAVFDR
jgi:hypothetical protein